MNYRSRISKLQKLLLEESKQPRGYRLGAPAALISSNPQAVLSHDQTHPYRSNSTTRYLLGSEREPLILIVRPEGKPILITTPNDPVRKLWDGPQEASEAVAERIGAEHVITKDLVSEALTRLKGAETVYSENIKRSPASHVVEKLYEKPHHSQSGYPRAFLPLEALMQHLRLYKDRQEIAAIEHAAKITGQALDRIQPLIRPGISEWTIAKTLEYHFGLGLGVPAFQSIVASGPNASYLHYHDHSRILKKNEWLLIDSGAEVSYYSADITRCYPVGEIIDPVLLDVYATVASAKMAAIKAIKDGVSILTVYTAAARELVYGLKELGVLKGRIDTLLKKKAHLPYFPHSIGHSLGLDVHDIGDLRGNTSPVLKAGMVFTIEPGLYFQKKTGKVPQCGVRLEDDILVTKRGSQNLTAIVP